MTISRRQFVKTGTMVGLSVALPLSAVEALAGQQRQVTQPGFEPLGRNSLDITRSLSKALFAANLNTPFRIQAEGAEAVDIELIKVADVLPVGGEISLETSRQTCFSVVFRGSQEKSLPQATYHVAHSQIGSFDLFLVPAGEDENGKRYEALFNHLGPYNLRRLLELRRLTR